MPRLTKRADGRYQKKLILPDGSAKFIYAKTVPELNKKAKDILDAAEKGYMLDNSTTVCEWALKWFTVYKKALKPTTKENYLAIYNAHILPTLGRLQLKQVKSIDIQELLNTVSQKSPSLQKKVIIILNGIFDTAADNGYVNKSPVTDAKVTKIPKEPKKKFLKPNEYNTFINEVTSPTAKVFCALCLYAGLRRAEALGLQWNDITDGVINIRRSVTFADNDTIIDDTVKSSTSFRTIPIIEPLKKILNETPKKGLFVVTSATGGVVSKSSFRRMWDRVKKEVSINKTEIVKSDGSITFKEVYPLHPHMLRHTYCTILYNAGVDLKTAQSLMGHSNIAITAQIYTHLDEENITQSSDKLNTYLASNQ